MSDQQSAPPVTVEGPMTPTRGAQLRLTGEAQEAALCRGFPGGPARDALRELVEGDALLHSDPMTVEMLEAFGWGPAGEMQEPPQQGG